MRFMTVSGYFTSKEGIKTLDYQGNAPNVWDGVPQEVLDKHGLAYDEKYLPLYVDQSRREIMAEWDDDGNLIS
jgi:gluconate 2-dehydrogenase gamma chain